MEKKPDLLKGSCRHCGGHIEFPASSLGDTILCPHCAQSTLLTIQEPREKVTSGVLPAAPPRPVPQLKPPAEALSLEMRVGTYWLVRIGIVLLLTGLVFFGNLAYQKYISQLGQAGKVTLLYLASAVLLGAGWWWQRQAVKESLKNYAQVLFGGGLAALYFTTYAAHHIELLRVIQSPGLDGVLLLACAAFMVWCADRKKSEVLALFAVGLGYYTSIITRVGYFTLYSNLVLTAAGVVFLLRNRWAMLSYGSLVATYAAYGFWRFFDGSAWHWASPAEGLWAGTWFMICYWLLFTAAVFASRDRQFAGQNRATFASLNNGAFFTMFLLTMMQVQQGGFWKFALIYGTTLLALADLSRRLLKEEPLTKNAYLTQGLLLVTVGFISRFAGLQLALVLAMESVVLLILGQQRKNLVLLTGAYLAAGLAVGWGIDGMRQMEPSGIWLAAGLGALMVVNTLLVSRQTPGREGEVLRPQTTYFSVLALVVLLVATYDNTTRQQLPVALTVEALALTLSIYLLRVREITLLGQGFLVAAQLAWLFNVFDLSEAPRWWNSLLLLGVTLALSHWWQKQKRLSLPGEVARFWQGLYALALAGMLYFWLNPKFSGSGWLAMTSLLAVGLTAYGVLTRAWMIAAFGQLFVVVSAIQFGAQVLQARAAWYFPLAPMVALGLLSGASVQWFRQRPGSDAQVREPLLQVARLYRWSALGMSLLWIWEYIPERERIWLLALLGLWAFVWSGLRKNNEALLFSGVFSAAALALFWLPMLRSHQVYWPNLCAIVALLTQRQVARRFPERYGLDPGIHTAVILAGGLSLWRFFSLWVMESASGFYLTACWSGLALVLFSVGIVLRERMYRWLGLGILGCALGRVIIFDVWRLESVYRILSLMALGVVLLVLGFVYSKYQEKIKEWL